MRALLFRFLLTVFALLAAPGGAQARAIRIVAFGDSATAGYLVARNEAYPAQLQAALRKKGYDVIVENAGLNGDTTAGALRRFDAAIGPIPTSPSSNSASTICAAADRLPAFAQDSPSSCARSRRGISRS